MSESVEIRKFVAPEFLFGNGSRLLVANYCKNYGLVRPMVVSDLGVWRAGWVDSVLSVLDAEGIEYLFYSKVTPNPKDIEVMEGARLYAENGCDGLIALGGGSVIDCAKGIGIVVSNGGHILQWEGVDTLVESLPPLICIPTTAGTAADMSQFAIINDTGNRNKISVISKIVVPDVSLVDPETTTTMPPFLTACTGIDAVTHAIEAMVSSGSSLLTDFHAANALSLLSQNLPKVIATPNDMDVRSNIMMGCLQAGLAFSNASLGAIHAMSHSLGGFIDLAHGQCNSILLDHVIRFNYSYAEDKYKKVASAFGIPLAGLNSREVQKRLVEHIVELKSLVGITEGLNSIGVVTSDHAELAEKAYKDPCILTNPRAASIADIQTIYAEAS